jgi:Tfp pilus assembly protein FimT
MAHRARKLARGGPARVPARRSPGFGLAELLVVVGIIAAISALALPSFFTYIRGSALKAGAQELQSILNVARSVAIKENSRVCVNRDTTGSNRVRLLIANASPCTAATFYGGGGHGTDARVGVGGWITMQNGIEVSAATADVIFTSLGAAAPGGTYTVSRNGQTLNVVVAPSGRVTITP